MITPPERPTFPSNYRLFHSQLITDIDHKALFGIDAEPLYRLEELLEQRLSGYSQFVLHRNGFVDYRRSKEYFYHPYLILGTPEAILTLEKSADLYSLFSDAELSSSLAELARQEQVCLVRIVADPNTAVSVSCPYSAWVRASSPSYRPRESPRWRLERSMVLKRLSLFGLCPPPHTKRQGSPYA